MSERANFLKTSSLSVKDDAGTATLTVPVDVLPHLAMQDDGGRVAWFEEEGKLYVVPVSEVRMR